MKSQQNNICICGHEFIRHRKIVNNRRGTGYCRECFDKNGGSKSNWHIFVPDNLRFLESKYEEKATEA